MATETERAFVLTDPPAADDLGPGTPFRQGYVAREGDVEVRIRITPDAATLTLKAGTGLTRSEVEVTISHDQAEALWPHTAGRRLEKLRHRLTLGEHTVELDVYAGELTGLVRAEVEFATEEAAHAFEPPAWFGIEVTGDPAWTNANLAQHGRPDR